MTRRLGWHLRLMAARVLHPIGWAGCAGLLLLLSAPAWLALQARPVPAAAPAVTRVEGARVAPPALAASQTVAAMAAPLPAADELPLLLTQVQQLVVTQGLEWQSVDYKLLPASDETPAAMEVRCTLKGPYPKLRLVVSRWLTTVPGLALRELSFTRPSSEAPEVEAKLTLVLFMQSSPAGPANPAQAARARP